MSAGKGKSTESAATGFTAAELKCIASLVEKEQKKLTGTAACIPIGFNPIKLSVVVDGSLTKGEDTQPLARFPEAGFWKIMYRVASKQKQVKQSHDQARQIFKELSNLPEKAAALENEIADAVRLEEAVRALWKAEGPRDKRAGQSQVAGFILKSEA